MYGCYLVMCCRLSYCALLVSLLVELLPDVKRLPLAFIGTRAEARKKRKRKNAIMNKLLINGFTVILLLTV